MASLPNYLLTHRKRSALSQEEAAFLVGAKGPGRAINVCRHEISARMPTLEAALAYEAIYGKPVRELFAGLYERVQQEVAERARIMKHRTTGKATPQRQEVITNLASKANA